MSGNPISSKDKKSIFLADHIGWSQLKSQAKQGQVWSRTETNDAIPVWCALLSNIAIYIQWVHHAPNFLYSPLTDNQTPFSLLLALRRYTYNMHIIQLTKTQFPPQETNAHLLWGTKKMGNLTSFLSGCNKLWPFCPTREQYPAWHQSDPNHSCCTLSTCYKDPSSNDGGSTET